jgi:hypothetical protein
VGLLRVVCGVGGDFFLRPFVAIEGVALEKLLGFALPQHQRELFVLFAGETVFGNLLAVALIVFFNALHRNCDTIGRKGAFSFLEPSFSH